jgi:lipopolysaccharide transport protein LptA
LISRNDTTPRIPARLLLGGVMVLALGLAVTGPLATRARADLLDEEDPATSTGTKPTTNPQTPPASKGNGDAGSTPTPDGKATPTPKPPKTPTVGGIQPGDVVGGSVLPPKNPNKPKPTGRDKQPVKFESRGLKGLREKGWVELESQVVVTQANLRLEADKAQVFYDEAQKDVQKVAAEGNVKISNIDENTGEKLKAYGDQVVFHNKDRVVILEGNARLWRGEDSVIRGKKIIYELDTGWIRAERVAGELSPQDKPPQKPTPSAAPPSAPLSAPPSAPKPGTPDATKGTTTTP